MKIGENIRKPLEETQKKKVEAKKAERPKTASPSPSGKIIKKSKKYAFSVKNVPKLKNESTEDYQTRVAFLTIEKQQKPEPVDPVEKHVIRKK